MSIALYVSPFVQMPKSRCSTASPEVAAAFGKEPVMDDEEARQQQELKERMEKMLRSGGAADMDTGALQAENAALKAENAELKAALESAQAELHALKKGGDGAEETRAAEAASSVSWGCAPPTGLGRSHFDSRYKAHSVSK
mmetsp:Transcript_45138/g.123833  ORF Transcript_45138/g.123833 Transcript_45138/m.123833 type:complete len:141 (+) Transcript_45138:761-1183(+)